ncbi:MAG: hypothetical protein COV70_01605 [Parcubacteria group bacterium CG11_big_fil_rev_8_21_14_0_20_39_22]|nr:MAG: hypothetical protein COV70_01605 [Parcubacteria group bacterium CG11_big_fil_rev_8_21_14_0_20_39_22]
MEQINFLNVEYIFQKGLELLSVNDLGGLFFLILAAIASFLSKITIFSIIISILLIIGIIYSTIRIKQIREEEQKIYGFTPEIESPQNDASKKWQSILEHTSSSNENDWRLAILEADIILDEMLDSMGYRGDTISDKLKQIEKSDFRSIDAAWEAHKVRNRIAHEGVAFKINEREVRRIIGLYEQVFREFRYI